MTAPVNGHPTLELEALNRRLAELLHTRPADLSLGAARAMADDLVFCGILGGKDVGKSTLINSLAGRRISGDEAEVGEGTSRPMAYVHESAADAVLARLDEIARVTPIDVSTHTADAIRNVVLLDLPDFDSEFRHHHEQVRRVAPLLDRVLWVVTPRKVGDRAWVDLFRKVIKDPGNVHCVLNKVDELLTDAEPFPAGRDRAEAFWAAQQHWFTQALHRAGLECDAQRDFIIASGYPDEERFLARIGWLWGDPAWRQYSAERDIVLRVARRASEDFRRLQACVLGPVSRDQAARIKQANESREKDAAAAFLREHYDLDRLAQRLDSVCDEAYRAALYEEAYGQAYAETVADALLTRVRPDARIAEDLLEKRLHDWPILGWVYGLFGWLPRWLAKRYAPQAPAPQGAPKDPFVVGGTGLEERQALLRSRLEADQAVLMARLQIDLARDAAEAVAAPSVAQSVRAKSASFAENIEARWLESVRVCDRPPRRWQRACVWLVLIWFPLAQPILEGVLHTLSAQGAGGVALGLYQIVAALGAVRLLSGLGVVVVAYVVLLAVMYARAVRDIRRSREDGAHRALVASMVEDMVMDDLVAPLIAPFQKKHETLDQLLSTLRTVGNLSTAA